MTYAAAVKYLYSQLPMFHRIGAAAYKADLSNTIKLCKLLGNPERKFKSIHVAGTNGKGSTSHMLAAILQAAGYKTGLYTSPHLLDYRERIRINGKMIPKQNVVAFIEEHRSAVSKIQPSFFEWTVGLCFDYFAKEKVDIAVIETGLGGRLDSTNVIKPVVSIITNISYDHMNLLGDTLEKIAVEKAGIIKSRTPVVIGAASGKVKKVFIDKAKEMNAPIVFAKAVKNVSCDLKGSYQRQNIATVLTAVNKLRKAGFKITDENIEHGLMHVTALTGLRGRWEKLSDDPLMYADVGHNKDGIKEVLKCIDEIRYNNLHLVLGFVQDKDVSSILKLLPPDAKYYFCKADLPRSMDENELAWLGFETGLRGNAYPSVETAIYSAKAAAGKNDLIFIGGSTFVVAEAMSAIGHGSTSSP